MQHIVKSLTVENVPYEMFTSFSATFEDVRRVSFNFYAKGIVSKTLQVQIAFFLENWSDIRASDAMRSIWQHIRVRRHPGFEEGLWTTVRAVNSDSCDILVWPLIAMNLEFRPQPNLNITGDKEQTERES